MRSMFDNEQIYILKRKIKAFLHSLVYYMCHIFPIKKNKVVFYVKDTGSGIKKITYSKNYKKYKKLNKKYYKKVKKGKYKGYYKVTIPVKKNTIFSFKVNDKAGNVGCIFNVSCRKK